MKKLISLLLGLLLVMALLPAQASSQPFWADYQALEQAAASVLYIEVVRDPQDVLVHMGSGFMAFDNKTLVTNYHVIQDALSIKIYDQAFYRYEFDRILAVDKTRDIAILGLKQPSRLLPLPLLDANYARRGQPVAAISYPHGLYNTLSTGILSAVAKEGTLDVLQFTAPISQGSSGGALLNEQGQVIGLITRTILDAQNLNFAAHIKHVIALYKSQVATASLGVVEGLRLSLQGSDVLLTWDDLPGASKYRVWRSLDEGTVYELAGDTGSALFVDSLRPGWQTCHYYIEAMGPPRQAIAVSDAAVITAPPGSTQASPSPAIDIQAPSGLRIFTDGISLILEWEPVPGAIAYEVYRAVGQGADFELFTTTGQTAFKNRALMPDTEYAYYVVALYPDGSESPQSATVSMALPEATPSPSPSPGPTRVPTPRPFHKASPTPRPSDIAQPAAPRNLQAKATGDAIALSWLPVRGVEGYVVYRASAPDGEFAELARLRSTRYVDKSGEGGLVYAYKVRSFVGELLSEDTATVTAMMPQPSPLPAGGAKQPLVIGDWTNYGSSKDPWLNPQIINQSQGTTVDWFTIEYYCTDENGQRIPFLGQEGSSLLHTYEVRIAPGESILAGEIGIPLARLPARRIYLAISAVHTSDGRTTNLPEPDRRYAWCELWQ